ncbi:MAG: hypothetical protein DME25_12875, partial [Verrucomicrobia bacterium]
LWFLGTLVPTIGLVQVGSQPMADRYKYIPSIGLFVMVVWGLAGLAPSKAATKWYWVLGTGTALGICLVSTRMQLKYWQDGEKVFRHAI